MKQLVDCVGMSARKKVLESGKKPRILAAMFDVSSKVGSTGGRTGSTGFKSGTLRKELRFDRFTTPIPGPDYSAVNSSSRSRGVAAVEPTQNGNIDDDEHKAQGNVDDSDIYYYSQEYNANANANANSNPGRYSPSSDSTSDGSEGGHPPSPSPSPRPGSAMSMMSMTMLSRRSGTPTISGYFGSGRMRSGSGSLLVPLGDRSATVTTTTGTGTSSGLLSIPSAGAGNLEFGIKDVDSEISEMYRREEVKFERELLTPKLDQKTRRKGSISSVVPSASCSYSTQSRVRPSPMEEPKGIAQSQSQTRHLRTRTLDDIFPDKLREMEQRHTSMMKDIEELEDKLAEVSSSYGFVR